MTQQWQLSGNAESVDWSDLAMAGRAYADNLVGEPAVSKIMHMMADEIGRLRTVIRPESYAKSDEKCVLYDTNHDAAPAARASTGNTHRSVEESSRPRRAHNPEIAGANPAAPTLDAALEAIADLPGERPPSAVSANGGTPSAASRDGSGTSNTHKPVAWARFYSNGGPESVYLDRPPADAVPLYRHPTPPQGSVQDEGSFRDSRNAKAPVAWAVETGGELEASFCGPAGREDAADWREQSDGVIVPLYRSPTLTDEEREAVEWAIYEGPLRSQAEGAEERADTLRKLLERLA